MCQLLELQSSSLSSRAECCRFRKLKLIAACLFEPPAGCALQKTIAYTLGHAVPEVRTRAPAMSAPAAPRDASTCRARADGAARAAAAPPAGAACRCCRSSLTWCLPSRWVRAQAAATAVHARGSLAWMPACSCLTALVLPSAPAAARPHRPAHPLYRPDHRAGAAAQQPQLCTASACMPQACSRRRSR